MLSWYAKLIWLMCAAPWGEGDNPSSLQNGSIPLYINGGTEYSVMQNFTSGYGFRAKGADYAHILHSGSAGEVLINNFDAMLTDTSDFMMGFWVNVTDLTAAVGYGRYRDVVSGDKRLQFLTNPNGLTAFQAASDWAVSANRDGVFSFDTSDTNGRHMYADSLIMLAFRATSWYEQGTTTFDIFINGGNLISDLSTINYWDQDTCIFNAAAFYIGSFSSGAPFFKGKMYAAWLSTVMTPYELDEIYALGPTMGLSAFDNGDSTASLIGAVIDSITPDSVSVGGTAYVRGDFIGYTPISGDSLYLSGLGKIPVLSGSDTMLSIILPSTTTGWYGDTLVTLKNGTSDTLIGDSIYIINFYTITITDSSNGSVQADSFTVDPGEPWTATAVADAGYSFVGWTGDTTATAATIVFPSVEADYSIAANFEFIPVLDSIVNWNPIGTLRSDVGIEGDTMTVYGVGFGTAGDSSKILLNSTGSVSVSSFITWDGLEDTITFIVPAGMPRGVYFSRVRESANLLTSATDGRKFYKFQPGAN